MYTVNKIEKGDRKKCNKKASAGWMCAEKKFDHLGYSNTLQKELGRYWRKVLQTPQMDAVCRLALNEKSSCLSPLLRQVGLNVIGRDMPN